LTVNESEICRDTITYTGLKLKLSISQIANLEARA